MKTIIHNNHRIEIKGSSILGKETIMYDGKVVSSKNSISGATHVFNIEEDESIIQYDVEIGMRWHGFSYWTTVRREGKVIFSDR